MESLQCQCFQSVENSSTKLLVHDVCSRDIPTIWGKNCRSVRWLLISLTHPNLFQNISGFTPNVNWKWSWLDSSILLDQWKIHQYDIILSMGKDVSKMVYKNTSFLETSTFQMYMLGYITFSEIKNVSNWNSHFIKQSRLTRNLGICLLLTFVFVNVRTHHCNI